MFGPLLYILYASGIGALLTSYGLSHQLYADDVQAYTHCSSDCVVAAVARMFRAMDAFSRLAEFFCENSVFWTSVYKSVFWIDRMQL